MGEVPGLEMQLWYLDDGALVGTRDSILSFLDRLQAQGPAFGLRINLEKCELFWPSGDQDFASFDSNIHRIDITSTGAELLGSHSLMIFSANAWTNSSCLSLTWLILMILK